MLIEILNYPKKQKKQLLKRIEYYLQFETEKIRELDNYEKTEIYYAWLCLEIDSIQLKLYHLNIALAVLNNEGYYTSPNIFYKKI